MSHHLRLSFIDSIQKSTSIPPADNREPEGHDQVKEIYSTDAEGCELRIEWFGGRTGRVRIGKGGDIINCVVFGKEGRERSTERRIYGDGKIEGLMERLGTALSPRL